VRCWQRQRYISYHNALSRCCTTATGASAWRTTGDGPSNITGRLHLLRRARAVAPAATRGAPGHGRSDAIEQRRPWLPLSPRAPSGLGARDTSKAGPWEFTPSHLYGFGDLSLRPGFRLRRRLSSGDFDKQPARTAAVTRLRIGGGRPAPPSPRGRGALICSCLVLYTPGAGRTLRERRVGVVARCGPALPPLCH
jgi:hypothetical protein